MAKIIKFPSNITRKRIKKKIDEEKRMEVAQKALADFLELAVPAAILIYQKIKESEGKK